VFPFSKNKPQFFLAQEKEQIVNAIREAEKTTSGEIRLFVESRCRFMDALDRAAEVFFHLKMDLTEDRNGVLVYIAMRDKQVAVFGDESIHNRLGAAFWQAEVEQMMEKFQGEHIVDGIVQCMADIGQALHKEFPFEPGHDKNQLPDDIVFGH